MKTNYNFTPVEEHFMKISGQSDPTTKIPYILVSNFPRLGFFTALRFLEWVKQNPHGVISLPTGKTPEFFIKWTQHILETWHEKATQNLLRCHGIKFNEKPDLSQLHFVQIDEFYPISSHQHNSFYNYVQNYYIKGFGLNPDNAITIKTEDIPLFEGKHFSEIFPNNLIDLTLRHREPVNKTEEQQQASIFLIDNWCSQYEERIRTLGGIGFFLGGIGPDGHIAFNVRGSDHNSTTRLTATNFETQAASASDLGGIEVSRNHLVITIGLQTITYNPNAVAIIFAAGEAKAGIVKNALQSPRDIRYPATTLQKLPMARFFLTNGAATQLNDSIKNYYTSGEWTIEKTDSAILELCQKMDCYAHNLTLNDLQNDPWCKLIPDLGNHTVNEVIHRTRKKIERGLQADHNETILHTGPHHDDIMLGIMPMIIHQLRDASNQFHFSVLTSGFTAVTNHLILNLLHHTLTLLQQDQIQMIHYPDFYTKGHLYKWNKDVSHYLNKVASHDEEGKTRGICHRLVRSMASIYPIQNTTELINTITQIIHQLNDSYDGEKNPPQIQQLKGMIREFEEELVWAHYGVRTEDIKHLRLGFYTGDIFTEQPDKSRDVIPILNMLRKIKPTIISLAFDPEGSGPDTHYKVLQAIAEAIRQWGKEYDLSRLRIRGYRNVWYRFNPAEANVYIPVSLNSMAVLNQSFRDCYFTQVNASFPSHEYDGPFSELSQRVWCEQLHDMQLLLGKDYFYDNPKPKIRATHGFIYYKEMEPQEFLTHARALEKSMEGAIINQTNNS